MSKNSLNVLAEKLAEKSGLSQIESELFIRKMFDVCHQGLAADVYKRQAHIAAGTRSFDITMPKEINRLVIDGLSDILFTAGISNNSIANKEGCLLYTSRCV